MSKIEKVRYSDFAVYEETKSSYISNKTIITEVGMSCPSCGTLQDEMEHWEHRMCVFCDLQMKKTGNALRIWR